MKQLSDQKTGLSAWFYPISIEPLSLRQLFLWVEAAGEAESDRRPAPGAFPSFSSRTP
jgi:hypothetical protein